MVSQPIETDFDVLIVGGGMVGLALAAALSRTSLRIGLVEAQTPTAKVAQDDGRASAIALGSVQILDQIGAWRFMQDRGVSPIHRVCISDQGFAPVTTLHRQDLGVEALGYVVENRLTLMGLQQTIASGNGVDWLCPGRAVQITPQANRVQVAIRQEGDLRQFSTRLLVGADGRQSAIRLWGQIPVTGWDYDQRLIVCTIITEFTHQQTGYERFHPSGPFAILPMVSPADAPDAHRCCIVWTTRAADAPVLMGLEDDALIAAMLPHLSPQLGQVLSVSRRACYAPRRQNARRYFGERLVLVGDAAHATHPVGGQGLNMGLRDVATLATLLIQAHIQGQDLAAPDLLRCYQQLRHRDNRTILFGTDLANRLFSNTCLPLQGLRRLALLGVDQLHPLKHQLLRYAMGLAQPQSISAGCLL